MYIEEIISNINLEDYTVEFKGIIEEGKSDNELKRKETSWLKTIVAFANTSGGNLYIGVDNKTHKILSLSHQEVDKIILMIQRLIKERIEPEINYEIKAISILNTLPTRYIIDLKVEKSSFPLVSLKENGINAIYLRKFGKNSIASPEEIVDLVSNSNYVSYDSRFSDEEFKKEDFSLLFTYYKDVNNKELSIKELISIGFINSLNKLSYGGLLFKDNLNNDKTLVSCTWFKGYDKGENIFLANETYKSNLLDEFNKIVDFIKTHSANGYQKNKLGRKEYIAYPLDAIREGVANALAHRNYFINGSQIEINIFKDRVEIVSPGSLLNSNKELREFKDLESIPPLRRNEVISKTFELLKIMENKGSGFDKIVSLYKPHGEKFAPFINSTSQYFSLTLADLTFKEGMIINNELVNISLPTFLNGKYDKEILSFCYKEAKSINEIASFLKIKPSTYFKNTYINKLLKDNYLFKINNIYPSKYITNHNKVFLE